MHAGQHVQPMTVPRPSGFFQPQSADSLTTRPVSAVNTPQHEDGTRQHASNAVHVHPVHQAPEGHGPSHVTHPTNSKLLVAHIDSHDGQLPKAGATSLYSGSIHQQLAASTHPTTTQQHPAPAANVVSSSHSVEKAPVMKASAGVAPAVSSSSHPVVVTPPAAAGDKFCECFDKSVLNNY
jgi:hypothetical protein